MAHHSHPHRHDTGRERAEGSSHGAVPELHAVPKAALGVDIGATTLAASVVDEHGTPLSYLSKPTPHGIGTTRESLWRAVSELMRTAVRRAGDVSLTGIGVGIAAPFDRARGTVSPLSLPEWSSFPLRDRINAVFPDLPVRMHSDSVCEVVGEHWVGSGRGMKNLLGVVSSMTVGGALIQDERLATGDEDGDRSGWLFRTSGAAVQSVAAASLAALSTVARGPKIATHAWSMGWKPSRASEPLGVAGAEDAAHDAARGDEAAIAAFRQAGRAIGESVGRAVSEVPLEAVLVTGGVAKSGELLIGPMREALRETVGDAADRITILERSLGDQAAAIGAAGLVLHGDRYYGAPEDSAPALADVISTASPQLVAA